MTRIETIKRFLKTTEGMGYIKGSCVADYERMNAAIEGELTYEKMVAAFEKLFMKPNFAPLDDYDRKIMNEMFEMTDEEFEEEFHAINGYYYKE